MFDVLPCLWPVQHGGLADDYVRAKSQRRSIDDNSHCAMLNSADIRYKIGDVYKNDEYVIDILAGGMGLVYIVEDSTTRERRAIKSFPRTHLWNRNVAERFDQETLTWTRLVPHPHVIRAQWYEVVANIPFLRLEYAPGGNMRQFLSTEKSTLESKLRIAMELAVGMQYLASQGIVHCDLKPENVLFDGAGHVKITDFGLSYSYTGALHLFGEFKATSTDTEMQGIAGTLLYLSPEVISGHTPTTKSDVYAYGVLLYELFVGRYPYGNESFEELMNSKMHSPPIEPLIIDPTLLPRLNGLILKCLAIEPQNRYDSFDNIHRDLDKITKELGLNIAVRTYTLEELQQDLSSNDWNSLGLSLKHMGRFIEASQCYSKALAQATDDNERCACLCNEARLYITMGASEEAQDSLDMLTEIQPRLNGDYLKFALLTQAFFHYKRFDFARALATLDQAISLNPKNFGLLITRARYSYNRSISVERMMDLLRDAEDVFPWEKERFNIHYGAVFSDEYGNSALALELFKRAFEFADPCLLADYNIGVLADRENEPEVAVSYYDAVLELDPKHSWTLFLRGLNNYKLGQIPFTIKDWKYLLQENPEFPIAEILQDLVRLLAMGAKPDEVIVKLDTEHLKRHLL